MQKYQILIKTANTDLKLCVLSQNRKIKKELFMEGRGENSV